MKSRILTLTPYDTISIAPYQIVFSPDEKQLEYELNRLCNPYITWSEGTQAGMGDMAVCRLVSDVSRFNKAGLPLTLGAGLMPPALEQAIVGMQVGETKDVALPDAQVAVTLLSVRNKHVPELRDDMVQALEIPGVTALAQYRAHLMALQRAEQAAKACYEPCRHVIDTVMNESEFVLHKEDWDRIVQLKLDRLRTLCRQDGLVFEDMTQEEFAAGRVPNVKCHEGVIALEQNASWDVLREFLLGRYYAEQDGFAPDEASYEAYLQEYVKSWGVTAEQARESNSYAFYELGEYSGYFYQKVNQYVNAHIFKEE